MAEASCEPINIFSRRIDPRGVIGVLRGLGAEVRVEGPEDDWTRVVVYVAKRGFFRRAASLTFGHDSAYYDGEGWSRQVLGMQGYFCNFPDTERKADVLRLIATFRFALSLPECDLDVCGSDVRLDLVYAVCRHLDGVIFTPSALRDASGHILLDTEGTFDPDAVLPAMPPVCTADEALAADSTSEADEECQPPTAERVMRRAFALAAVSTRAMLERDAEQIDDPESERRQLNQWVTNIGIGEELEPDEWKVLQRPIGTLDQRALIDSMWRLESLVVLSWALQLHPLPQYDELVDPSELLRAVGVFDAEKCRRLLASATLREEKELHEMNDHLLAFHWRVRDYSLRAQPMDFVTFSRNCWFGSFDISKFEVKDGDLAIGGQPISKASDEARSRASSTASERHQAINWLRGDSRVFSETDTST
jgi:hypothetical protein